MRTILFVLIVSILLLSSCIYGDEFESRFTFWGVQQKDFSSESDFQMRIGYERSDFIFHEPNNTIEFFFGMNFIPEVEGETGKIDPPTSLLLGGIYTFGNLLDKEKPLPFISPTLIALLPDTYIANPYFGTQATYQLVDDDGYLWGTMAGIKAKPDIKSPFEYIFEAGYNNFFGNMSPLKDDDEFILYLGLRIYTK